MRIKENIDENWLFRKENTDFQAINLPHTWNAEDGQLGESDYHRGKGYYQKNFTVSPYQGKIYLEFEAVNHQATVSLNGTLLGTHQGGFSTFRFDVTSYIREGENCLEVMAHNSEELPIYPQHADFTFFGGIYRSVYLIYVEETHFDLDYFGGLGIYITSQCKEKMAEIQVNSFVTGDCRDVTASFQVLDKDGDVVVISEHCEISSEKVESILQFPDPQLWNGLKNPYLYSLKAILQRGTCEIDQVTISFGIRNFSIDSHKGFYLNNESVPLRGVSKHQDRQDKGWATSKEDLREDMALIKEMGANTIRLAHYQHPQYFYDLCDQEGMVVWAEIPFITTFLPEAVENTMTQMKELVVQNYNHPSICFWGISNEITIGDELPEMVDNQKQLQALIKKLDPHRYTTLANMTFVEMDSEQNTIADLVAYNHYFGWYKGEMTDQEQWLDQFHNKFPEKPLCLSEYGVEAVLQYHSDTPKIKDYSEEYQCIFHQHMAEIFQERPYLWGTYVWNMFDFAANERDEGGVKGRNNKGLVSFDRQIKKDSFYVYKAFWNTTTPFVHIAGRRFVDRTTETVNISVYSNESEVKLVVNEEVFQILTGNKVFFFENVPLSFGENTLETVAASSSDKITLHRVDTPNPTYVLSTTVQEDSTVQNWFEDKELVAQELTFDPDYFSVKDKLKSVIAKPEGMALFEELLISAGITPNIRNMKMVHRVKIETIIKMAGSALPENSIYTINHRLQQIKKQL